MTNAFYRTFYRRQPQGGPKGRHEHPKTTQDSPKTAQKAAMSTPRRPKRAPRRPKRVPRRPPCALSGLQERPKRAQDRPKTAQVGSKTTQEASKTAQERSKRLPKTAPRSQNHKCPLRFREDFRMVAFSRCAQGSLGGFPARPKTTQKDTMSAPRLPKRAPRRSKKPPCAPRQPWALIRSIRFRSGALLPVPTGSRRSKRAEDPSKTAQVRSKTTLPRRPKSAPRWGAWRLGSCRGRGWQGGQTTTPIKFPKAQGGKAGVPGEAGELPGDAGELWDAR